MAFAAADGRLRNRAVGFFAVRLNLDAPLKERQERSANPDFELHMPARIRPQDLRNRAGGAHIPRPAFPLGFQQSAFFDIATAIIVAIKMNTFPSSGRFHESIDAVWDE